MQEVLDEKSFNEYIKTGLKLVMFGSDICRYCIKQKSVLDELAQGGINIGKVDAYKTPVLTQKYGVTSFPAFVLFKFGDIVTRFSGFKNKSELLDIVLKYV